MNLFDVVPFLGRRARYALVVASVIGLAILSGPTRSIVGGQFNDLRAQITQELMQLIPAQFRTHTPRRATAALGGVAARTH